MLLFFKVCLVLLGFKVYTSKIFGFHVQYWREVNFKVNHFTVVCVRRAISSASVVLIHYYWFQIKKQCVTHLGALSTGEKCAPHLITLLPPDQSGRVVNTVFYGNNATAGWETACFSSFTSRISSFSVRDDCVSPITPSFVLLFTQIKETFCFKIRAAFLLSL